MTAQLEAYIAELKLLPEPPPFDPEIEDFDSVQDKKLR